ATRCKSNSIALSLSLALSLVILADATGPALGSAPLIGFEQHTIANLVVWHQSASFTYSLATWILGICTRISLQNMFVFTEKDRDSSPQRPHAPEKTESCSFSFSLSPRQ